VARLSSDRGSVKPQPSVEQVLGAIRALSAELEHLDQVAGERYRLNRTDMRGLELIGREGPLTPTQLAHRLALTTGGVTTVIDRLERAGYVERRSDPSDRRRVVLETTHASHELDRSVFGPLIDRTLRFLKRRTKADLAVIFEYLEGMRELTSSAAADIQRQGG
jgi:DNA-binding MarR family transcriptional regulator